MRRLYRFVRVLLLLLVAASLAGCEQPQVYGSIGYSSYGSHGGGFGGSISLGGRIF